MKNCKRLIAGIGCLGLTACASSPPYAHYSQVYYGHPSAAYHSYSYRPYPYSGYEYYERSSGFNYPHYYGNGGGYIEQRTWVQPPQHHQPRHLTQERFPNQNHLEHHRHERANSMPDQLAQPAQNPAHGNVQQTQSPEAGFPDTQQHHHSPAAVSSEPQIIDSGNQANQEFNHHQAQTRQNLESTPIEQGNPEPQRHHGGNHANHDADSGNDRSNQQNQ